MTRRHRGAELRSRFKRFKKEMYAIWESYELLGFYMPLVHRAVVQRGMPSVETRDVPTGTLRVATKNTTYGMISRLHPKANARRTLMDALATFEYALADLCFTVYRDFPGRLCTTGGTEGSERQEKLINVIVDSATREEIIDRIVEERVRGVFYGNPIDFFGKDKGKLGLDAALASKYPVSLAQLCEIIARRNIYAHNDGRVDRKYLREVRGSSLNLDDIPETTDDYLRDSIDLLIGFVGLAAAAAVQTVYGQALANELTRISLRFSKARK